jgi:hypothetical protein
MNVDDKITKEKFCEFAMSAINSIASLPDDMWEWALPTVTLRYKDSSYEVVVGLRDAEAADDESQATIDRIQATLDRLSVTVERYKRALTRISELRGNRVDIGMSVRAIADEALGNPPKQEEDDDL